jgi:hypothetical protein
MMFAPLEGWRFTDRHIAVDYAQVLQDLAHVHFANARTIVLVQQNLNIHSKASLYEPFPAPEARRLVEPLRMALHLKARSWLDLAESELGILSSQCLDRRTIKEPLSRKSPPGSTTAMPTTPKPTGTSVWTGRALQAKNIRRR